MALVILFLTLGGCAGAPRSCAATAASPEASAFCVVTADGWDVQAVEWSGGANDSTRAVLLVHGLNEDHHSFDAIALDLAASGWRVVAFDVRGMGLSTNQGKFTSFTPDDFLHMDRDVDAVRAHLGGSVALRALVGASVGSSTTLRWADEHDRGVALALLSPGLGYQGIPITQAVKDHAGPALFLASSGDAYSANSISQIAPEHPGAKVVRVLDGARHGTQILQDADGRAIVEGWLANATS